MKLSLVWSCLSERLPHVSLPPGILYMSKTNHQRHPQLWPQLYCTSRTFNTVAMVRSPQALASKATCNQAIYISVLFEVVARQAQIVDSTFVCIP